MNRISRLVARDVFMVGPQKRCINEGKAHLNAPGATRTRNR